MNPRPFGIEPKSTALDHSATPTSCRTQPKAPLIEYSSIRKSKMFGLLLHVVPVDPRVALQLVVPDLLARVVRCVVMVLWSVFGAFFVINFGGFHEVRWLCVDVLVSKRCAHGLWLVWCLLVGEVDFRSSIIFLCKP